MNKFNVLKVIRHMVNAALATVSGLAEAGNKAILQEILAVLEKHGINEN